MLAKKTHHTPKNCSRPTSKIQNQQKNTEKLFFCYTFPVLSNMLNIISSLLKFLLDFFLLFLEFLIIRFLSAEEISERMKICQFVNEWSR